MKKKHTEKTELETKLEAELAQEAAKTATATEEAPAPQEDVDVAALIADVDATKNQLLRTLAEFDNFRKRVARDAEQTRKKAAESLIRDLLPVLDNLERGFEHAADASEGFVQGVEMVLKQFREALERHGLKQIPALGQLFDPHVHEALMQAPSADVAADHVLQEFQKGYQLGDYVLRPAKVVVSSGNPEAQPEE